MLFSAFYSYEGHRRWPAFPLGTLGCPWQLGGVVPTLTRLPQGVEIGANLGKVLMGRWKGNEGAHGSLEILILNLSCNAVTENMYLENIAVCLESMFWIWIVKSNFKYFFQAGSHSFHLRFMAIRGHHLLDFLGFLFFMMGKKWKGRFWQNGSFHGRNISLLFGIFPPLSQNFSSIFI